EVALRAVHLERLRRARSTRFPYTTLFRSKPVPGEVDSWAEQMEILARLPNVSCKFSGLLTELPAEGPAEALAAIFDHLWNAFGRSEEHTSELQSLRHLVCRLLLEKKNADL